MTSTDPVGEVRVAETHDGFVVLPRRGATLPALREALGDIAGRQSTGGLRVEQRDAARLLASNAALVWQPQAQQFARNRVRARAAHPLLREQVELIKAGGAAVARSAAPDLDDHGVLDDHQLVNVAAMTVPVGYGACVFDEQGAGKTVTTIYAFDLLSSRDQADFLLIAAPKSMVAEWPEDFRRFMGNLYRVTRLSGSRRERLAAIADPGNVVVAGYETMVSMEAELAALLRGYNGRAVLVVDESFYVKNLDARRTRSLRRLREWCGRAYVLCGTPAPNSPHDLVQQVNLVDFGTAFDGVPVPDDRAEAAPVVRGVLTDRAVYVRHLKVDVLPDLPGRSFTRLTVNLAPQQQSIYEAALHDLADDLRATSDTEFRRQITSFFARRSALLQVCSNPTGVVDGYSETPAKLTLLDGLMDELVRRRGEKLVVWSFYTRSLDTIMSRYADLNPVRYDGTVSSQDDRRAAVRNFQDDDSTMLFIGNPAAAGAGLTLHRSRYAVYESFSNQAAHYLQSLDRIHRRGQEREVEYFVLLCDNTIELNEYRRLINKEQTARDLLGDMVDESPTREALLAEVTQLLGLLGASA